MYEETIDSIVGIINEKDFHNLVLRDGNAVKQIIKPVEFIPPSMKISALLKLLQQNKSHLAVIVDEFGGTEGIVTLEDIIEELVGEIWDEHDEVTEFLHKQTNTTKWWKRFKRLATTNTLSIAPPTLTTFLNTSI